MKKVQYEEDKEKIGMELSRGDETKVIRTGEERRGE